MIDAYSFAVGLGAGLTLGIILTTIAIAALLRGEG